jgi:hypothetical protein
LVSSGSRYPEISLQSAEVGVTKIDSKSVAYKNRTKNAKCGGLETNAPRERISGLGERVAVRRFVREGRGYWRFQRAKTRQRMLVAEGLAEREGFELAMQFFEDSGDCKMLRKGQISNNIIQKGLAFLSQQSGSVDSSER